MQHSTEWVGNTAQANASKPMLEPDPDHAQRQQAIYDRTQARIDQNAKDRAAQ